MDLQNARLFATWAEGDQQQLLIGYLPTNLLRIFSSFYVTPEKGLLYQFSWKS
jgi:hypothetical protein